jgi:hypothetical protein
MDNNNNGYISRMIRGITNTNSVRPAATPESVFPFFLGQNRDSNNININDNNFISNYDTNLNSPVSQDSRSNIRDSLSENIYSENDEPNKNKLKKMEISFHDSDSESNKIHISTQKVKSSDLDSQMKEMKSTESNFRTNSEISNLNESDNLSRKLKINNPAMSYQNNFKADTYLSDNNNNKNNFDIEKSLYSRNIMYNKFQKNEIIKKTYEPTITINIGKITVRYTSNNNSKNIKDMNNGIRNSNKLSLSDYLKKRSAGDK